MGFFTGFFSGFALTSSALYITIQVHRKNRIEQRNAIRQHVEALNWVSASTGAYERRLAPKTLEPTDEQKASSQQSVVKDIFKEKWNQEVKTFAQKVHDSRWEDVRDAASEGWRAAMRLVRKE